MEVRPRRGMLLAFAALAAAVGPAAFAGMGPERGLPHAWTPTRQQGLFPPARYPVRLNGNALSGMCVECHAANRSGAVRTGVVRPFAEPEARYRGSHFVRNGMDGVDHATMASPPEKLDEWGGTGTGRRSKYGNFTALGSVAGVAGDVICESCHNVVRNLNPFLRLAAHDEPTGVSEFCGGCHTTITGPSHHPLGAVDATDDAGVRNPPLDPLETDGVGYFLAPNVVTCLSCHKVHDAQTATGARLLRRGHSQVSAIAGVLQGPVNVVYYLDRPFVGTVPGTQAQQSSTGLHRQSDMVAGRRLVTNADPLCDACHKYDD